MEGGGCIFQYLPAVFTMGGTVLWYCNFTLSTSARTPRQSIFSFGLHVPTLQTSNWRDLTIQQRHFSSTSDTPIFPTSQYSLQYGNSVHSRRGFSSRSHRLSYLNPFGAPTLLPLANFNCHLIFFWNFFFSEMNRWPDIS